MDRAQLIALYAQMRKGRLPVYHTSISEQQKRFRNDVPAKGPMFVCPVTILAGNDNSVNDVVEEAIKTLGEGDEKYVMPCITEVKAEWVANRAGVEKDTPPKKIAEALRYSTMMKDVTSEMVMLYAHGGASYVGSAAGSRPMIARLAALTGGRVLSVDYGLAPQHVFPTQLIEVLIAYLSLLYPPPNSSHEPVLPKNLVLVGDSFGGTLMLALIQVILNFNKRTSSASSGTHRNLEFHGQQVPLPLPARIALISAYGYTPDVFPSWRGNMATDSFPELQQPFFIQATVPPCDAWPMPSPTADTSLIQQLPRGDIYCDTSILSHPIVCPSTAKSWKGSPPMFLANGEECCIESLQVMAQQALKDGVVVDWEEYEAMCHVWLIFFPKLWQSELVFRRWANFVKGNEMIAGSKGVLVRLDKIKKEIDLKRMTDITPEKAKNLIDNAKAERNEWVASLQTPKTKL